MGQGYIKNTQMYNNTIKNQIANEMGYVRMTYGGPGAGGTYFDIDTKKVVTQPPNWKGKEMPQELFIPKADYEASLTSDLPHAWGFPKDFVPAEDDYYYTKAQAEADKAIKPWIGAPKAQTDPEDKGGTTPKKMGLNKLYQDTFQDIKLTVLLVEGISSKQIMDIVTKVYPQISKDLGGRPVKVEVHNNIYKRIDAVGIEDMMKDNNPYAEYDWDKNKIYLYASAISNVEQIIRSLLHEHTHTRQNRKKFRDGYESGKYTYANHPYELAAVKAEKRWKNYLRYLK